MKLRNVTVFGAALFALGLNSCAPQGGIPSIPGSAPGVEDIVTSGLRSGDQAINRNHIDALLNNPRNRPGLATGWGAERKSEMDYTPFTRTSSKPVGTDTIFYNDTEGMEAMAGNREKVGAMQRAAGELVEWGIKGGFGYLPTYKDYGFRRRLVAGKKGGNYSIVVKNRSKSDLEIVASVDGLDVQDGRPASFSKRGYIVAPGTTVNIEGFRTSADTVASFKFSSVSNSYANMKHGNTRNVGVIGIAVFTRKGVNPWGRMPAEVRKRGTASPFAEAP